MPELLGEYADVMAELKRRNVIRSANNPTADYAEGLFCRCFGWTQAKASSAGHDAVADDGTRIQIKSRRLTSSNGSRQLGALRRLDQDPFDILAGVIFDERFGVLRAALIPIAIVQDRSKPHAHTNSRLFFLEDKVWQMPGVEDVTEALRTESKQRIAASP